MQDLVISNSRAEPTLSHLPLSSFTFISGFVTAFKPAPRFWSQDLFLCMNKCEERQLDMCTLCDKKIYIGHICWGNPLRSLIEGGLWIQGSHNVDTQERTVTWMGSKSAALFPSSSWSPFDWGYLKPVWPRYALMVVFLFECVRGLVRIDQDVSPPPEISPTDTPPIYTPLIPVGFGTFQEVFDDKANLNADSSLPLTGVSFSYRFPTFPRMLFDNPRKCAVVCIQLLTLHVSRKKNIRKRTVQQTHPGLLRNKILIITFNTVMFFCNSTVNALNIG